MRSLSISTMIIFAVAGLCFSIFLTISTTPELVPVETTIEHVILYAVEMECTAYCPCEKCCGRWVDGKTYSGHVIKYGDKLVAAGPEFSIGDEILIPGYNNGESVFVEDRGGAISHGRLDLLFYEKSPDSNMTDLEYSHQLALEYGRKKLTIIKVKRSAHHVGTK